MGADHSPDLSGNLHVGSKAIPGAVEAVDKLRKAKLPIRFCSSVALCMT